MICYDDFDQYTPDYWRVRRGLPTASEFANIITPAKGDLSATAIKYACQLIADMYSDLYGQETGVVTTAMRNGTNTEPEARACYAFSVDADVKQVGFCTTDDGRIGCSPDGLVGDDGVLELKCPEPHTHVAYLLDGGLPAKYKPQVHGHLMVTGRAWCDFVSYSPGLPPLIVRVTPDEYTEKVREALAGFLVLLDETREKLNLPEPPEYVPPVNADVSADELPAALAI